MLSVSITTPWLLSCHSFPLLTRKLNRNTDATQTHRYSAAGEHSGWKCSYTTEGDTRVRQNTYKALNMQLTLCTAVSSSSMPWKSLWLFSCWDFGFFIEARKKPICVDHTFKEEKLKWIAQRWQARSFAVFLSKAILASSPAAFLQLQFKRLSLTALILSLTSSKNNNAVYGLSAELPVHLSALHYINCEEPWGQTSATSTLGGCN